MVFSKIDIVHETPDAAYTWDGKFTLVRWIKGTNGVLRRRSLSLSRPTASHARKMAVRDDAWTQSQILSAF